MNDLSKIPTTELVKDLGDSIYDIFVATKAMEENSLTMALKDGSLVALRAGRNLHFVNVICKELVRRQYMPRPE